MGGGWVKGGGEGSKGERRYTQMGADEREWSGFGRFWGAHPRWRGFPVYAFGGLRVRPAVGLRR